MKKKTGVIAGVGRMGGGRDSPVGYGYMDDNGDVRRKIPSLPNLAQLSFFFFALTFSSSPRNPPTPSTNYYHFAFCVALLSFIFDLVVVTFIFALFAFRVESSWQCCTTFGMMA